MLFLRLFPILVAFLFILSRTVNIKVTKSWEMTVKVNFNIFAIVLKEEKLRKIKRLKIKSIIQCATALYKSLEYLIEKSAITLYTSELSTNTVSDTSVFHSLYTLMARRFVILLLSKSSRKFTVTNTKSFDNKSDKFTQYELVIYFSLWRLIISALFFLYYIVKTKAKKVFRNV